MKKPKRKRLTVRLPKGLTALVALIAKRAGVKQTDVYNVLLVIGLMREEDVRAAIPDAARRRR